MITKEKMPWCFIKFSQLILKGNVWRSVWRICMWILGLKGLNLFYLLEVFTAVCTCNFLKDFWRKFLWKIPKEGLRYLLWRKKNGILGKKKDTLPCFNLHFYWIFITRLVDSCIFFNLCLLFWHQIIHFGKKSKGR